MRYEDVLPLIRSGRLVRRASWDVGVCVGCSEYQIIQGELTSISEFSQYDQRGSHRTWTGVRMCSDLLASDWEVVPVLNETYDGLPSDYRSALSELALELTHSEYKSDDNLRRNLSMLLHEGAEAYKTEDPERLKGALLHGVCALAEIRYRLSKDSSL